MQNPLISAVHARNYRSIADARLELGPITALVGLNAAGKSNLVDIPRFISDALTIDLDQAVSSRGGIEAIRRWSPSRPRNIEVGLTMPPPAKVEYGFTLAAKPGGAYAVSREYGKFQLPRERSVVEYQVENGKLAHPSDLVQEAIESGVTELALPSLPRLVSRDPRGMAFRAAVASFLRRMRELRFYSISPAAIGTIQKPGLPYPLDEHGENSASLLRQLKKDAPDQFHRIAETLGALVPGVADLDVRPSGGYLVTRIQREDADKKGAPSWLSSDHESVGTLRLLGILLAIHQRPAPRFVALEEPEVNVHPGAAAKLADYLQSVTPETQVLVTTHSPDFIDPLPAEAIRAVKFENGTTTVGPVSNRQLRAAREELFTLGELHQQEGLEPEPVAR